MSATFELPTSDPPKAFVEVHGSPLAFADEGPREAPAVVLLHGIPGSVRDFRYLAPQLADAVRVVRVDLPGFGDSPPTRDAVETMPGRARAVLALAERLGLERFAVLGHSMGGGPALALAAWQPQRVTLLGLVCSVALSRHRGLGMTPATFGRVGRLLRVPLAGRLLLPWVRAEYRRRGFPGVEEMDAEALSLQMRAIAAADFAALRRWARGPLPPTLVAYARDDHMVETRVSEELAAALPHARVLAFDEGGHNLQKTRAVELAQALKECLLAQRRCDMSANPISL